MAKTHHIHDRSIEHAKSRDTMAHRLISPGAPEGGHRSTRGFPTADIVNAKTVQVPPALDVQPRHGGKAKGGVVEHSWGNTEQQIAKENTAHVVTQAVDASSASPLDLMTSSQAGKHLPIPAASWGNSSDPERGSYDPTAAGKVAGEAIISSSDKLPEGVSEES